MSADIFNGMERTNGIPGVEQNIPNLALEKENDN